MSQRDMSEQTEAGALEASLEKYRAAACAEADAQFDDRALESQRHKILARLAHLGHPARVIRFPKGPYGDVPSSGVNRRWISVAAAAGLLIGLLGGQVVNLLPQQTRRAAPVTTSVAPTTPASDPAFVPALGPVDDGLLSEIELMMEVRSASAIRALDEFTFASR